MVVGPGMHSLFTGCNMAATEEEFYQRRGDRAPEKEDFHRLPVEDKRLICQLRSAVDVARDKVTTLRDEVEDK